MEKVEKNIIKRYCALLLDSQQRALTVKEIEFIEFASEFVLFAIKNDINILLNCTYNFNKWYSD